MLRPLVGTLATAALLLGGASGGPARAEPGYLLATASEVTETASDDQSHLLDLGSGTSFAFTLANPANVAIFFSASCRVSASDPITWVDIDVLIDGVAPPPIDFPEPLCASSISMIRASRDAVVALPAGPHTLEVAARLFSFQAGESWMIGNKSLILLIQETP